MGTHSLSLSQGALLCFCLSLFFAAGLCHVSGSDEAPAVEVVDKRESDIGFKTSLSYFKHPPFKPHPWKKPFYKKPIPPVPVYQKPPLPQVPVYQKPPLPPVPIYKPKPKPPIVYKPIPKIPKKPCPPIPKPHPKYFFHKNPKFGTLPPFPPHHP